MAIIIRRATEGDAEGIARVQVDTWKASYRGQLPDDHLDSISVEKKLPNWVKYLTTPDSKMAYFIAEDDDRIVGFCVAGPNTDDDKEEKAGEVHAIYVDPEYQGKGIGSALMKDAAAFLKEENYDEVRLWALKTNKQGGEFYQGQGFELDGKEKKEEADDGTEYDEVRFHRKLS